jgi:uncharacterized protein (DUF3820 family)
MEDATSPQNLSELYSAIVKMQSETKDILADAKNPFHKNNYATLSAHLSALKPIFAKNGLAVIQMPCSAGETIWGNDRVGGIGIKTIIAHTNGTSIESIISIPVDTKTTGQQAGALLTYLRRYALASVAGVATDDDDCEIDRITRAPASAPAYTHAPAYTPKASAPKSTAPAPASAGEPNFELAVPFGKNKGTALKDLPDSDLEYWANKWEPKPWEKTGKVGAKDLLLKKSAQALYALKSNATPEEEPQDEVPF